MELTFSDILLVLDLVWRLEHALCTIDVGQYAH